MRLKAVSVITALLSVGYAHFDSSLDDDQALAKRVNIAGGTELRILPLGDSITVGFQSSDGNGYRIGLQEDLAGSKLQFVGGLQNGSMLDNFNSGYSGYTINEISNAANDAISSDRPNIILLHAGTNDLDRGDNPPDPIGEAPDRLGQLIDKCISGNPNSAIIVAQIINAADPGTESRIQTFNAAVPGVVNQRADAGHHVMVVDMQSISASDLVDGLHPTDAGYRKMADLWLDAIKAADGKGWIKPPVGPDPDVTPTKAAAGSGGGSGKTVNGACLASRDTFRQTCLGLPIWHNPAPDNGLIASGVAKGGDAKYVMNWLPQGRVALGIGKNGSNVRFADLNSDGRADYLWVDDEDGAVIAYLNTGQGNKISWEPVNDGKPMAYGVGKGAGVRFANMGGQKQVDYLLVDHDNGAVHLYENKGADESSLGKWKWVGPTLIASGAPGADHWNVEFADLNGDGRDDYIVVGDHGSLELYLNTGIPGAEKPIWIPSGQVATGVGKNFTLADIDGDGRDDYLTWTEFGGLGGYLNARDRTEALPKWIDQGSDTSIATGVGVDWRLCRLADLTGDGKADYAVIDIRNGGVDLYINDGHADTSVAGDEVFLVDLDGDGLDDYLSMDQNGKIIAYLNGGPDAASYLGWKWIPQNKGNAIALGVGARREQVRLANIYGNGRADYLVIDDKTGAVNAWENEGPDESSVGAWKWSARGQIATGIGDGAGVRFADIDGDGLDDYVWLSEDGKALVYINKVGQIPQNWVGLNDGKYVALGVGAYRKDIRLADLDGDGRSDYIWFGYTLQPRSTKANANVPHRVHAVDGSIDVWRNNWEAGPGNWAPYNHKLALGVGLAGPNIHFARINFDRTGRADYVAVEPSSGGLRVWMNGCDKLAPGSSSSGSGSSGQGGHGNSASCQAPASPANTAPSNSGSPANQNGSPSKGSGVPAIAGVLVTLGDSTYTANSKTQIVIDGETLTPGGQIVAGGTTVSLAPGASVAVVGGSTQSLGLTLPTPTAGTVVFGGSTYTANAASQYVIAGQTLTANGQITVFGTPISLGPAGSLVVIAGSTQPLGGAKATPLPVFTLGGSTITADSASRLVIDGQTLTPGGGINVDGTSIILPPDASAIVVGTSTERPAILPPTAGPSPTGPSPVAPSPAGPSPVGPASQGITGKPCGAVSTGLNECGTSVTPGGSGNGDGITIPDYTTVASAPKLGSLPTSGLDAISALKSTASAWLTLLSSAGNAFSDLASGNGLTSGAVSDAAGLFTSTIEDGQSLLNAMNSFEMQSFDQVGGNLVSEINTAKSRLGNLINFLRTTPQDFARWITKPPQGLTDYRKISAYLIGTGSAGSLASAALKPIFQGPTAASTSSSQTQSKGVGVDASQKTATATSASSAASESARREWTLNTVPGTSIAEFEAFVQSLPDKGTGRRYTYSELDYQDYTGKWTLEEARVIAKIPIVDQLCANDGLDLQPHRARGENTTFQKDRRVVEPSISYQLHSPLHLKIVSLPKIEPIGTFDQSAGWSEYFHETSLGDGAFIYHIDSGFDRNHPEFAYVHAEGHAVTGAGDPFSDSSGHGTQVAGMAVGLTNGVAKRATIVAVKITGNDRVVSQETVKEGWRWAINDIKRDRPEGNRIGKAVILFPYGGPYEKSIEQNNHVDYLRWNLPVPEYCDIHLPLLAEAWENDIVTVISNGNDAAVTLGDLSPQRFGRFDNALITVGTATANGDLFFAHSALPGPPSNGHDPDMTGYRDLLAYSVDVPTAIAGGTIGRRTGSSLAAPQVAGLAAYLLTAPSHQPVSYPGHFSLDMTALLGRLARLTDQNYLLINNDIRTVFCAPGSTKMVKVRKATDEEGPVDDMSMTEYLMNNDSMVNLPAREVLPEVEHRALPSDAPAFLPNNGPPQILASAKPTSVAAESTPTHSRTSFDLSHTVLHSVLTRSSIDLSHTVLHSVGPSQSQPSVESGAGVVGGIQVANVEGDHFSCVP